MTILWQDVRYGFRMLRKNPGFTAIALVTLAVGIGANTIMFSISDLLLLRPANVRDPEQLAYCGIQGRQYGRHRYSEYLALRDSRLAFSDLMAQEIGIWSEATVVHGDSTWQVQATYVSANYFSMLGGDPVQGRSFLPEEERSGSAPVVVLSHRCWRRLGCDPQVVGGFLSVNGVRCQVVGIAPEGFTGIELAGNHMWLPLGSFRAVSRSARDRPDREMWLDLVGRLKPGVTMSIAQAQLQPLIARFHQEDPKRWSERVAFDLHPPGRFMIEGDAEDDRLAVTVFSLVLMAASAIVLVIACLNLANMLIVQGTSRHREIAVRMALGGGRWRIVRQLLIESLLLALLGGVLGVLLAFCGTRILSVWIATAKDGLRELLPGLNVRVLAATLGFCLIATLLFGLRPALWLSKRDIAGEIKAAGGRALGGFRKRRGAFLVAGQIALAVALVLSAALLTRSALQMVRPDSRFCLEDKLIVEIDLLSAGYDQAGSVQACETLADRLASLPEVQAVGTSTGSFYGGGGHVDIGEYRPGSDENKRSRPLARDAALVSVDRDFFTTLEIPLLWGRRFDRRDRVPNAEKVAIIDESLARKLRRDGNALDCLIQWGMYGHISDGPFRVVGIVAHLPGIEDRQVHAQMYVPVGSGDACSYFYVHAADGGSVDILRRRIIEEMHQVDSRVPVLSVATLAQKRAEESSVWLARFGARLGLSAGAAALFLAALGIYAIKGYTVAARTPEIGIRKALGATQGNVIGMVLRECLVMTMVGLAVGLLLGLGIAKVAARFLYGVSPIDPVSIVATIGLLGAASLLAGYLPARRAAKVDPMVALRYE